MEKLTIEERRDTIIVEKSIGGVVEKGSRFYCGCCGNVLGVSKKRLMFPFSVKEFHSALENKTFESTVFGLYHKTCKHTMFGFGRGYGFMTLESYVSK